MTDNKFTTVPAAAAWYVRTGLDRSLGDTLERINQSLNNADRADCPGSIRQSLLGAASYDLQWCREALDAYNLLPDTLRPVSFADSDRRRATLWQRLLDARLADDLAAQIASERNAARPSPAEEA